ncbi:helix-turn-helix domain-containing protein [Leptothoe spongobia]|uniref:Helix-turn-helix transcriptional regulator n=1 Tax=Leptothoe spongobia TAU-MAC 1115 TaxID=1967444 RepID=A0A947DKK6_9CYAN|nr:helix-turn-helix transcriptional regulator [Leptothoe spongobia]MBT9317684.1 helix-turn-helix transcriptional regulator [Leptothoe spongobia TAU-MAC 1115]
MLDPNGSKVEGNSPLKAIREGLLKISQQEFASMIGIAVSTVSRWERGNGTPVFTPGQFKLIMDKLSEKGVSIKDLPDDWSAGKTSK